MLLEKRSARLSVNVQLVGLADLEHSIATLASLILGFRDGVREEPLVPLETELVHRVDHAQISQHEEESGSHLRAWPEGTSSVVDPLHCEFGLIESDLDFV